MPLPPVPLPDPKTLPPELRDQHAYIVWRLGYRTDREGRVKRGPDGRPKLDKSPCERRRGRDHDMTDAAIRSGLADALADAEVLWKEFGPRYGIGLTFCAAKGVVGLDFDGDLAAGPSDRLTWLGRYHPSYGEESVSGTGGHLYYVGDFKGKKEVAWRGAKLEVFGSVGFLAMTGKSLDTSVTGMADGAEVLARILRESGQTAESCHSPCGPSHLDKPDLFTVASALGSVHCYDPHGEWVEVGMSLHSWDPAQGLGLWTDWSRRSDKFDEADLRKRWKSFKADGKRTIGTLFHLAQKNGWRFPGPTILLNGRPIGAKAGKPSIAAGTCTSSSNESAMESTLEFTPLSTIKARPVKWLVPKRIPRGKVTIIAADGGSGKSTFTRSLIASITRGFCAFGLDYPSPGAADVILCAAEDSYEEVVVPHLVVEGANLDRVCQVHHVETDPKGEKFKIHLSLEHLHDLKQRLLQRPQTAMMVIDPIISLAANARINPDKAEEVRRILDPLNKLAAETNVAIVVIAHLNKSPTPRAAGRIAGSTQWLAGVRLAYMVAVDPQDESQRLVMPVKRNLMGVEDKAVVFRLNNLEDWEAEQFRGHPSMSELSDEDFRDVVTQMARVKFEPPVKVSADEVFSAKPAENSSGCEEWLKNRLGTEFAWHDDVILKEAAGSGFSLGQYKRAKKNLRNEGLRSAPEEFGGRWRVGFGQVKTMPMAPDQQQPAEHTDGTVQTEQTEQTEQTVETGAAADLFPTQSEQSEQCAQSEQSEQSEHKKHKKKTTTKRSGRVARGRRKKPIGPGDERDAMA
jgi:hypothetical protein